MKSVIKSILECKLTDEQTAIWYLGQEGFLFKHSGKYYVIDAYLSDYVDKNCCQLTQWKRLYPAPIKGSDLFFVDAVICTHSHYDHADPWTLSEIEKNNPKAVFIVPFPEIDTISAYGIDKARIIGAKADEKIELQGLKITPVPSAHEVFHKDKFGNYRELGYILDYGRNRFFHAGDMCMYDGLEDRLNNIDIGFLPINGRDYFRNRNDIIGNFDCNEAVTLAKDTGMGMVVPMHHDLYPVNRVNPENFVQAICGINCHQKYHIFAPMERYIFMK